MARRWWDKEVLDLEGVRDTVKATDVALELELELELE